MVFVYHSELTHNTVISFTNHGKTWVMPDGEVFDHVDTLINDHNCAERVILIQADYNITVTDASNLG